MSTTFQQVETINTKVQPFRVDVQLHDLLKKPEVPLQFVPSPRTTPQELPVPVFPQHPELLVDECQTHCFSTLNHNLAYCYDSTRAIKWILRQAARAFQGVSGSFED